MDSFGAAIVLTVGSGVGTYLLTEKTALKSKFSPEARYYMVVGGMFVGLALGTGVIGAEFRRGY